MSRFLDEADRERGGDQTGPQRRPVRWGRLLLGLVGLLVGVLLIVTGLGILDVGVPENPDSPTGTNPTTTATR
jgi:hypothetical protein